MRISVFGFGCVTFDTPKDYRPRGVQVVEIIRIGLGFGFLNRVPKSVRRVASFKAEKAQQDQQCTKDINFSRIVFLGEK